MKTLRLGSKLTLPLDAVTRTTAIVGQRGSGKTSTAGVMVEEAAGAGAQFAVVDPTGAWYGLRSSADGNGPGLDVVVFGGHHGDVPLEPGAGAFIARLIIDQGISVVLDLELMTKAKQVQFVAEFAEELYHANRTALTLVVDEAHRFAPQQLRDPGGYGARCLGAVTDVVTLGRRKGLGAILISQRPAKINKDVFEQAEIMVAHRLMGPNDRKAIASWLDEALGGTDVQLGTMAGLDRGEAVVWAPDFDLFGKFAIRAKRTFDSSATPEIGQKAVEPRGRADVDLAAIESAMSETIERAKADDPKALRARIRELERAAAEVAKSETSEPEVIHVPAWPFSDDEFDRAIREAEDALSHAEQAAGALEPIRELVIDARTNAGRIVELLRAWGARRDEAGESIDKLLAVGAGNLASRGRPPAPSSAPRPSPAVRAAARPDLARAAAPLGGTNGSGTSPVGARETLDGDVTPARQRVLDALAWFGAIGVPRPSRAALAPLAGSKATSGGFKNNLGALRTAGLVDYPQPNRVALTADGERAAVAPDIEPTPEALQTAVLATLAPARQRLLEVLIASYPHPVAREDLAAAVGVPSTSGGFKNNLGALRTQELIDYPGPGLVAAQPLLFLEAER